MNLPTRQNLYRKYRSQTFSELLGQDHVVRTLQSAVSQGRMSHAYLFSGPRGTGKTSAARLLGKILNCHQPVTGANGLADPCRTCSVCQRIEEQTFLDIIEIDAASNNSVEDIRDMREKVKYVPVEGKYKVYIIDEVHMLSGAAFNAFLKTLEEPPPRVIFILATTDPQKVPATIISRCQCFDFHSVSTKIMVEHLARIVQMEKESDAKGFPSVSRDALFAIAESVDGGFRDALSLLDQLTSASTGEEVTIDDVLTLTRRVGFQTLKKLAEAVFSGSSAQVLSELNDLYLRGYDVHSVGRDYLEFLRRCMVFHVDQKAHQILQMPAEQAKELHALVAPLPLELILSMISDLERVLSQLRYSVNPKLLFEVELIKLTHREIAVGMEGLLRRLDQLETGLKPRVGPTRPPPAGSPPGLRPVSPPHSATVREPPREFAPPPPGPNLSHLPPKERFPAFRKTLTDKNPVIGSYFQSAVLESMKEGEVVILLSSDFAVRQVVDSKNAGFIAGIAEGIFGKGVKMVFRSLHSPPESGGKAAPPPGNLKEHIANIEKEERRKILEKPEINEALKLFGGEIIGIEKKGSQKSDN